jgi:hypothetical protein
VNNLSPTFIITREDQVVDPVTLSTQALRVGRQTDCEILLNHPTVSRLHAGINEVDGRFYLINLSSSHPVTLNGRLVELNEPEALADGDVAQIGSFFLHMSRVGAALKIQVAFEIATNIAEAVEEAAQEQPLAPDSAVALPKVADALKEFWDKRTRDKAARPSPLHPRQPPQPGKARFSWKPTKDLVRPWPFSVFIWALIVIGLVSVAAAFWHPKAFSPAPISNAHARVSLVHKTSADAIARQPNAGSCTSCHAIKVEMEANCASCHQTEAFNAALSGIPAHAEAGIGCASCHAEHQGADFRPTEAALNICAKCHSDENKNLYRGRRLHTPHGGTVGYPVVDGVWKWAGLSDEAWKQLPNDATEALKRARERMKGETDEQWRSRQFHALHVQRVLARGVGLTGNAEGELSCSSCHKSFDPIDRATPATTCASCHNGNNGQVDSTGRRTLIAANAANCSSCHIQHLKEPGHWNPKLLAEEISRKGAKAQRRAGQD